MGLSAYFRLVHTGWVLAREGILAIMDSPAVPPAMRAGLRIGRLLERPEVRRTGRVERLTNALNRLGPTYVKFGQILATRPDIVGAAVADDLSVLQDKMEPFDPASVPGLLRAALGAKADALSELSAPIAAASIAQVHRAVLTDADGRRTVAVKVLRPGVAERFRRDIEAQYAGARLAEALVPRLRRLRPVEIVKTLDRSARLELDLRLEAAAISELAGNIEGDTGFVIPKVFWNQTAANVLTTGWVEGIPARNLAAIDAAGLDRKKIAANLLQSFLRHAMRDGFFHGDLHPGNLFVDPKTHDVIAVDFGIMGRINRRERRFLAEILYGFITRDYHMIARRHFEIGYVLADQSVDDFALALRAIGEPQQGRLASDISMAEVLGQLFATTEMFQMKARPELILLQKAMVLVEGVSRAIDPDLDIFTVAEPVVGEFVRRAAGPVGRLEQLQDHAETAFKTLGRVPALMTRVETVLDAQQQAARSPGRKWHHALQLTAFVAIICAAVVYIVTQLAG